MPIPKKIFISAVTAALALGVASISTAVARDDSAAAPQKAAEQSGEAGKEKKKKRHGCPFRRAISGFSVVGRNHFVLRSGSQDYLVTLSPGCHHLNFETAIAIKSTPAAGICVERGDRVILDHGFTCFIREIEWVEDRKAAKKLVEERTKAEEEAKKEDAGEDG